MKLGPVHLTVRDRARSEHFYREVLGADASVVVLHETPQARVEPQRAGLFHTALLYAGRPELGAVLKRLPVPLDGASDHLVSEALYLRDPDGLGVELYWDRPGAPRDLGTLPLDVEKLAGEAGPFAPPLRVGHVHLEVLDLPASRRFYGELGMAVEHDWPGALFMAWDGYHHHLGLNRWGRKSQPASPDCVGLRAFTVEGLPSPLTDPSGIGVWPSVLKDGNQISTSATKQG